MDRSEEFKDVPWQQGRLLITETTKRWNKETQAGADLLEQCCAFAHFTADDEGRGRQFVARYANPEECAAAVKSHNDALLKVPNGTN